jgi:hypothetical protein
LLSGLTGPSALEQRKTTPREGCLQHFADAEEQRSMTRSTAGQLESARNSSIVYIHLSSDTESEALSHLTVAVSQD